MNAFYLIGGLIVAALFIYLVVSVLRPEWFE
jgi:K+-transporting ATPase KdpF subunit